MNFPAALYVHLPFCRHRCGYCNFSLVTGRDHWIDRYLETLEVELASRHRALSETAHPDVTETAPQADRLQLPYLQTLYLGGGTPSHLPLEKLAELFARLARWVHWDADTEVTMEANPLDVTADFVERLQQIGVNRVSLGGQSFSDAKLTQLDRDHSGAQVRVALERLLPEIPNVSLDLIFAAPGETSEVLQQDLAAAAALQVPHLSTYGLTIEKGTQFWNQRARGELQELEDELFARLYRQVIEFATTHGWEHYEVSSFARPGFRSRHNQVYWNGAEYEAIGSGAARYVAGVRETNHASPARYMQLIEERGVATVERDELPRQERALELLVVGLRQIEGLSAGEFSRRTGFQIAELGGETLEQVCQQGLLAWEDDRLKLTPRGLPVSDAIWSALLTQPSPRIASAGG